MNRKRNRLPIIDSFHYPQQPGLHQVKGWSRENSQWVFQMGSPRWTTWACCLPCGMPYQRAALGRDSGTQILTFHQQLKTSQTLMSTLRRHLHVNLGFWWRRYIEWKWLREKASKAVSVWSRSQELSVGRRNQGKQRKFENQVFENSSVGTSEWTETENDRRARGEIWLILSPGGQVLKYFEGGKELIILPGATKWLLDTEAQNLPLHLPTWRNLL